MVGHFPYYRLVGEILASRTSLGKVVDISSIHEMQENRESYRHRGPYAEDLSAVRSECSAALMRIFSAK